MRNKILILTAFLICLAFSTTSAVAESSKVLMGIYPGGSLQTASVMDNLNEMNNWLINNGASEVTIAGDFVSITLNPSWNVWHELTGAWENEYIPFINLMLSTSGEGQYYDPNCVTSQQIADGKCDGRIAIWADYYKEWAGSNKMAYIALLPEANGDWTYYSTTGPVFINAFRRIQTIFANRGVPDNTVKWVFAPNGWHDAKNNDWRKFENYYPGDAYVDVVAFSSYNFGGCPTQWAEWSTYQDIFEPYLVRMTALAPTKPIFIAQTGTVGRAPDGDDDPSHNKNDWLREVFSDLAGYPNLRAILYFNVEKQKPLGHCPTIDFRVFDPDEIPPIQKQGLLDALSDPRFGDFIFADVQPVDPDSGLQNIWYYDAVHTIYNLGITRGCSENPLMYCPDNPVTRAEMAVFPLKSMGITPPPVNGSHPFSDIAGHWAEAYIEELNDQGITGGYPDGTYRPGNTVTRAEMSLFILRSKYWADFSPNPATGTRFDDVIPDDDINDWADDWIEALAGEGITGGCSANPPLYCPSSQVTRAEMAVFLVKAFDLQ